MLTRELTLRPIVIAAAAVFALLAAPLAVDLVVDDLSWAPVAMAEEDGGGGSGSVNKGGHHGTQPEGKGGPKWEQGAMPWPEGKGPPEDSDYWNNDGRGPRMGGDPDHMRKPDEGGGGRPQWASQELEDIGRLNVARAPEDVLLRAEDGGLDEVSGDLSFYTQVATILASYDLTDEAQKAQAVEAIAALLRTDPTRVDSPLANLAFYKDILDGDNTITRSDGTVVFVLPDGMSADILAAVFLGSAADKTLAVEAGTVHAVDIIFEFEAPTTPPENTDLTQDTTLALAADVVRTAIETVHGE